MFRRKLGLLTAVALGQDASPKGHRAVPCKRDTANVSQHVGPVQLACERRTVWIREFGWSHVMHLPSFEVILMTR
ncbi:hypothetical protein PSENEW3n2_00000845 [Picochlorum sp. SENEW3]|nr:hypothetical protein PSENEW3n2_00000845 [Picochlorum sp. SENEW3]WPT15767.1 hypothetical protein PSENEW3_00000845 [Picochlorum sp. SENEW3]